MARAPIHPGEILSDEVEETGLSAKGLADIIRVPPNRLYQILAGKRNMTADTALVSLNLETADGSFVQAEK